MPLVKDVSVDSIPSMRVANPTITTEGGNKMVEPNRSVGDTDSVAIFSGGLDSTTLVYYMLSEGMRPYLLSFNYGQRHKKELVYAIATAKQLGLPHDIVDLSGMTHLISNSALTSKPNLRNLENETFISVPEGHYAEESMKATVVPNRNMIMLSIAAGVAVNAKAKCIGIGVHAGDHFVYPDCRPEFIFATGRAIKKGNEGFHNFYVDTDLRHHLEEAKGASFQGDEGIQPIFAPFLDETKADIAYLAMELEVPLHMTWSCYKGGYKHCGRCGTCVERLEAIDTATLTYMSVNTEGFQAVQDMTEYEDTEYWKTVLKK